MKEFVISIYKTLILIVVLPLIIFGLIEWYNVNTNSYKLTPLVEIGIDEAAKMFSEESFCLGGNPQDLFPILTGTKRVRTTDIFNPVTTSTTDVLAVLNIHNELFDNQTTVDGIYDYLFEDIKSFANNRDRNCVDIDGRTLTGNEVFGRIFRNLRLMTDESDIIGKVYRDNYVTPMNLGIPYLNDETVTAMAKWNLAKILNVDGKSGSYAASLYSATQLKNLHKDRVGVYVSWNGYRVYIDKLKLDIKYRLMDMSSNDDKEEFKAETSMQPDVLFNSDAILAGSNEKYFILTEITYELPILYEGITPWRRAFSWVLSGGFAADGAVTGNTLDSTAYDADKVYISGSYVTGAEGFLYDMNPAGTIPTTETTPSTSGLVFKDKTDEYKLTGTVMHYIVK